MSKGICIDGYFITVEDRKLVIDSPELQAPIQMIFNPLEASQLSVLLNKLVPDDYGVRSDFRIPITEDMGLKTLLLIGEKNYPVNTTSLSLSGIYCELESAASKASAGDMCRIGFAFEDQTVVLDGIVIRSVSKGLGVAFTDPEPSDELSKLVMSVQRKWISVKSS